MQRYILHAQFPQPLHKYIFHKGQQQPKHNASDGYSYKAQTGRTQGESAGYHRCGSKLKGYQPRSVVDQGFSLQDFHRLMGDVDFLFQGANGYSIGRSECRSQCKRRSQRYDRKQPIEKEAQDGYRHEYQPQR
ncbi:hypothetical protein D3C73_787460 [compost metagenome]